MTLERADQALDLTECDREPIHIPGSIQPHGVLFVLQEPAFTILQVSSNVGEVLGLQADDLLNNSLETLFEPEQIDSLKASLQHEELEHAPLYIFTVKVKGQERVFDGVVHRIDGMLALELEPARAALTPQTSSLDIYHSIRVAFAQLQRVSTVKALSQLVAEQVQTLTGFDRVMVYRFEEDGHGVVIAEAKREDLSSYLDLHYPASDIPVQARRLYVLNWLRLITDVNYTPTPLIPLSNPLTHKPFDMSYTTLRSVSPIHIEYLKNMGVTASMSISIVQDNTLWGLIACHHYTPRYVPYDIRTASELVGRMMSLQLPTIAEQEDAISINRLKDVQTQLVEAMSSEVLLSDGLTRHHPTVLDFVDASGAAVCIDDTYRLLGQTPPEEGVRRIIDWLTQQTTNEEIFHTNSLSRLYPEAAQWKDVASGLLALTLSRAQQQYILWFRPEVIQTIHWGGDPNKAVEASEQGLRLSPRKSFEKWKQTVQGTALPWKRFELEAVADLRTAMIRVVLRKADELARLNTELARSNIELDAFAYIASHDLKEPLRGIHNYAHFLMEDYANLLDKEGVHKLNTLISLTQRMEDLINSLLYYSRVGRLDLSITEIDLNEVLQETLEMLRIRLEESGTQVRVPRPLPTIFCDRVRVGEVFNNLITNAIKYNDKTEKWIEIGFSQPGAQDQPAALDESTQQREPTTIFYVRDNGIGISEKHYESIFRIFKRLYTREEFGGGTGAGLTIVKKIVERHGGRIWVESREGEGSTFFFTLESGVEP